MWSNMATAAIQANKTTLAITSNNSNHNNYNYISDDNMTQHQTLFAVSWLEKEIQTTKTKKRFFFL